MERPSLSKAAADALISYAWPGNVRELRNVVERLVLRASGATIELSHLPPEIVASPVADHAPPPIVTLSHQARIEEMLTRVLVHQESFWTVVYGPFMSRDITREDLRHIVRTGLERTRGSYRLLLELFNLEASDYKRFLGFLKQHDCHLPFQRFRMASPGSATSDRHPDRQPIRNRA
jgi:DNA-binding NtrC family response regulator